MPPESRSTGVVGAVGERHEAEQLVRAPGRLGPRDVEVAREDQEVLAHGQLEVERGVLGDDAEVALQLPRPDVGVDAQHLQLAGVARRQARQHPHRGRLAGPVRAEEAEAVARLDAEVDAVDRGDLSVGLGQAPREHRGGGRLRARAGPPTPIAASVSRRPCSSSTVGDQSSSSWASAMSGRRTAGSSDRQGLEDDRRAAARDAHDDLGELEDRELGRVAQVDRLVVVAVDQPQEALDEVGRRSRTSASGRRRRRPSAACPRGPGAGRSGSPARRGGACAARRC